MTEPKRLYRSRKSRVFAGVCGGLADYFNVDPVIIRLGWALGTILLALVGGLVAYLIAWLVIPEAPLLPAAPLQAAPPL